jgi:hypothetical protein
MGFASVSVTLLNPQGQRLRVYAAGSAQPTIESRPLPSDPVIEGCCARASRRVD